MSEGEATKSAEPAASNGESESVTERVFFHEDDAFHVRTDWFLVGHAILFEAFIGAHSLVAIPVWIFGFIAAWAWVGVAARQLPNLDELKRRFRASSPAYDSIQRDRAARDQEPRSWMFPSRHATRVFGQYLPWACFLAWLLMGTGRYYLWCRFDEEAHLHEVAPWWALPLGLAVLAAGALALDRFRASPRNRR